MSYQTGIVENGVGVIAFSDGVTAAANVLEHASTMPVKYIHRLERDMQQVGGSREDTVCIDFCSGNDACVLTTIHTALRKQGISLVGGTGDQGRVSANGRVYPDAVAYGLVRNLHGRVKTYKENIYHQLGNYRFIASGTDRSNYILGSLNGRPAKQVYQRQAEAGTGFVFHPRAEDEKSNTLRVGGSCHDDIVLLQGERAARCVAVRGRFNPETGRNEQTPELRPDGKTNCLTSVEKDNLIYIESACLTPRRTEYGKAIRRQYEAGEIQESRHNMTELEPRTDGKTNTLTTVQKDNLILQLPHGLNAGGIFRDKAPTVTSSRYEANNIVQSREVIQLNPDTESGGKQPYQQNRVYSADGITPALCSAHAGHAPAVLTPDAVLRRLTPTECSRLQTIPD